MAGKPKLQWWVIPGIVTGSIAALGGLGTCAVKYATYDALPTRVEASEKKNELQDDAILELKKSNEVWQDIYQQQQRMMPMQQQAPNQPYSPARSEPIRDYDKWQNEWCCWEESKEACWARDAWVRCE